MIFNNVSNVAAGNKQVRYIMLNNKVIWPTTATPTLCAVVIANVGAWGVAFDTSMNCLYVADDVNNQIKKIFLNSKSNATIAGTGIAYYGGDSGQAINAGISAPFGFAVDMNNNLYFSDTSNHRIRKIDTNGIITTIAGTGLSGYNGDNITATSAQINVPRGLDFDISGNLYFADTFNQKIRKIDTNGIITTIAGTGTKGFSGDGGLATYAAFSNPCDVKIDSNGNVYIADTGNQRVRKINTSGIINTIVGNGTNIIKDNSALLTTGQNQPFCLALSATSPGSYSGLFITNYLGNSVYYANLNTQNGFIYAGNIGGGNVRLAALNRPVGVAIDQYNTVYIGDSYNNRVVALHSA